MRKIILMLFCFLMIYSNLIAQGYLCAVGGGSEDYNRWSDEPYRWMVAMAGNGPALVLHYDEGSEWLENYFKSFGAASATSLVLAGRSAANDSNNYKKIIAVKMIFLRGGDQFKYYQNWKGTLAEQAIKKVFAAGGVIGGSSAGLAILGGIDYTAANRSAISSDCLRNPFHRDVTLADDFLPLLPGVIFDSHFTARARHGRLLAFVANWMKSKAQDILGIGVDEQTAVCVYPNGECFISGAGSAVLVHQNATSRLRCESNQPLFFTDWTIHSLTGGFRYDLTNRRLVSAPEHARLITTSPETIATPAATLILQGTDSPAGSQAQLQQLCLQAGGAPVVLLTGVAGAAFASYLSSQPGCTNLTHIALTPENIQSTATENQIRSANFFILAGLSTEEVGTLLVPTSLAKSALQTRLATPGVYFLVIGPANQVVGAVMIENLETGEDNLRNGKLTIAPGWNLLNSVNMMPQAFTLDDFDENRVGGFFWQMFKNPRGLGVLLDQDCAIEISDKSIKPKTPVPAVILDMKNVSVIDSSDYKRRSYYQPQQSAGFYGGVLHCLPVDTTGLFNLATRRWDEITGIDEQETDHVPTQPTGYRLDVYPNPGTEHFIFALNLGYNRLNIESTLTLFNILGQQVARLKIRTNGDDGKFFWNGKDDQGRYLPPGIYVASARAGGKQVARKFVVTGR